MARPRHLARPRAIFVALSLAAAAATPSASQTGSYRAVADRLEAADRMDVGRCRIDDAGGGAVPPEAARQKVGLRFRRDLWEIGTLGDLGTYLCLSGGRMDYRKAGEAAIIPGEVTLTLDLAEGYGLRLSCTPNGSFLNCGSVHARGGRPLERLQNLAAPLPGVGVADGVDNFLGLLARGPQSIVDWTASGREYWLETFLWLARDIRSAEDFQTDGIDVLEAEAMATVAATQGTIFPELDARPTEGDHLWIDLFCGSDLREQELVEGAAAVPCVATLLTAPQDPGERAALAARYALAEVAQLEGDDPFPTQAPRRLVYLGPDDGRLVLLGLIDLPDAEMRNLGRLVVLASRDIGGLEEQQRALETFRALSTR